ncbi:adhesin, partial [Candidatus Magnetomorum sp. HK-1]
DTFNDVDSGDSLTYTATLMDGSALPSWLSFTGATRNFGGTPSNGDVRTITITVKATDTGALTATDSFKLTVVNVNDAPILANAISDESATEDSAYNFTFASNTFTDEDAGDTLTYAATQSDGSALPTWLTFTSATRTFGGTPDNADVGTLTIQVTATDTGSLTATDTFDIVVSNVNDAPTVANAILDQSTNEDIAYSFTFASDTFNDVDSGDSLTYTATLFDGSALPSWLSFTGATRNFGGTPANGDVGMLTIKVTATDTGSLTVADSFDLTVVNVNDAPILANAISNESATEDSAYNFTFASNTFTDEDTGDTLTYAATQSDGSALPSWLTFTSATRTFSGTPDDADVGTLTIEVTATDTGSLTATDTFDIVVSDVNDAPTVANGIEDQSTNEDIAYSFTFASDTFNDVDSGDSLTYTATLFDGSALPSWLSFTGATRNFGGTPANGDVGMLTIKVTATDTGSLTVADSFDLTVVNVNDAPTVATLLNQTIDEDSALSTSISVTDVDSSALTLTVISSDTSIINNTAISINRSVGTSYKISTLSLSQTLALAITPIADENGSVTLTVTVTDSGALTAQTSFVLTIDAVNDSPTITGDTFSIQENSANNTSVGSLTVSDIDEDTLTVSITGGNTNLEFAINNSGDLTVNNGSQLDFETQRTYTLTVEVSDGTLTDTAQVIVNLTDVNETPVISLINDLTSNEYATTNPIAFTVLDVDGDALSITVTSSDAAVVAIDASNITLCYQDCETGGSMSLTPTNAIQSLSLNILPANDGVANITITVADAELTSSSSFTLTVVNVNIAPVIGSIADTSMNEDATESISFTVVDADCEGKDLTLTVVTDNSTLLPTKASNVSIESSGLTHTLNADTVMDVNLSVIPLSNEFGTCGITITVIDANGESATSNFTLTVDMLNDDAPELGLISNYTINEDTTNYQTSLTVVDHDGGQLNIEIQSSDTSIVPEENVTVSGINFNDPNLTTTAHESETLTITINPIVDANGNVTITVVATDAQNLSVTSSFDLTVSPVDDAPVIAEISDFHIDEDTSSYSVSFTIVDADGGNVSLNATSGLTTLIANSDLTFSSSSVSTSEGAEETLTLYVSTQTNANGAAPVTITVTDPSGLTGSTSFEITVDPVNDPPTISEISDQFIYEDHSTSPITLSISDIEVGDLTISVGTSATTSLPATSLTFADNQNGSYAYTTATDEETKSLTLVILPPLNINGIFDISLTVSDAEGLTDTAQFSLNITPVNDMPFFTLGDPPTVDEDSATQIMKEWITDISAGAADETEPLTFTWSVENSAILVDSENLISGIDIAISGTTAQLTFSPYKDAHGTALVTISLTDGYSTTANQTFGITINSVNDSPSFTAGGNQIVVGNVGNMQIIENWATQIDIGPEDEKNGQSASFIVTVQKDELFENAPIVTSDGTLKYKPIEKAYGVSEVYVYLSDGGTGAYTSGTKTFSIDLSSINSQPGFAVGSDINVSEDSGENYFVDWATSIDTGHVDESEQKIEFSITGTNLGIFRVPPSIQYTQGNTTANLIFTTEADTNGTATLYITMKDSGGTVDGGNDTYTRQTMTIVIEPVNDAPSFTKGKDIAIKAENKLRTFAEWATDIKAGPGNEKDQTYSFSLAADDTSLFNTQPGIDTSGTLTFKPNPSKTGSTTVTVKMHDSEGADSAESTFTIETTGTASPEISFIEDQHVAQDTPSDELGFTVSDEDTDVYSLILSATSTDTDLIPNDYILFGGTGVSRTLSISPTTGSFGEAIVTVELFDGTNTATESFAVTVYAKPEAMIAVAETYGTTGTVPLTVQLTPTNISGEITSWYWDFGDNTSSTNRSPFHTYGLSIFGGDQSFYTVSLTVSGPGGSSTVTEPNFITVNALKYADFVASSRSGVYPLTVYFADDSMNIEGTRSWDIDGDNTIDYGDQIGISHTYHTPGQYTVTLNVGNYAETKLAFIDVFGRTISGKITDSSGNGIKDISVDVHLSGKTYPKGSAVTDSNGDYSITDLPSTLGLVISAWPSSSQYLYKYYDDQNTRTSATRISTLIGDLTDIDLQLEDAPTDSIKGRITDGTTNGEPGMSGVIVEVYSSLLDFSGSTTTDTDGNYTFTGLKSATDYILSVYDDRFATEFFYHATEDAVTDRSVASRIIPTTPALENMDIVIRLSDTIYGQVTDDTGKALSDIWVQAQDVNDSYNYRSSRTDGEGRYTITGLDNVYYYVEILPMAYPYQAYNLATSRASATQVTINSFDINFILQTGSSIRGRVTNINNGMLSNVKVYASSATTTTQSMAWTDVAGQYTLTNLPYATDYVVYADAGNYPIQYYNLADNRNDATHVSLAYGDVNNVNFVLDKGGVIHGNVRIGDSTNPAGQGIQVNISSATSQTGGTVSTDANGVFEIMGLDKSVTDYIIYIWDQNYVDAYYNSNAANTTAYNIADAEGIAPDEAYHNIVLKKGYKVCGNVSAVDNSIIDSFTVELVSLANSVYRLTKVSGNTQANAPYCVHNVIDGTYEATVQAANYADQTVDVTVSGNRSDVNFDLNLPSRAIGGTVFNIKSGRIATISASSDEFVIGNIKTVTVSGNGDVGYTIEGLKPASNYVIELRSSSYPNQIYDGQNDVTNADKINVMNSNQSGVDFNLPDVVPEISGTVTFPLTSAVNGDEVAVQAFSNNGSSGNTTVKFNGNANVSYRITGLSEITDYKVSVWSNKYKLKYYDNVFIKSLARNVNTADVIIDDQINFVLKTGRNITGQVFNSDGNPVANVYVEAQSLGDNSIWTSTTTETDGSYLLGGLDERSDYIVSAKKTDIPKAYYSNTDSVTNELLADTVSVMTADADNISITIPTGLSIKGTIKNSESRGVANVWVNASSHTNGVENGVYSEIDGSYNIKGLASANDYVVTAIPQPGQTYVKQNKTGVSAGTNGLDFILIEGHTLEGSVIAQSSGVPITKANVILQSSSNDYYYKKGLSNSGQFEIGGLPSGTDYLLTIKPYSTISYISVNINYTIDSDRLNQLIPLAQSVQIIGTVKDDKGSTVTNATISAFSTNAGNIVIDTKSDSSGAFALTNIPDASDYVLTITHSDYSEKKIDVTIGQSIEIVLNKGGNITGQVRTESGPLAAVSVSLWSESLLLFEDVMADTDGNFKFTGVPITKNGFDVEDYEITVDGNSAGYPNKIKSGLKAGDNVIVILERILNNEIKGTIRDSNGNLLPDGGNYSVKIYIAGTGKVVLAAQDGTGQFTIKGLEPGKDYTLIFKPSGVSNFDPYEYGVYRTAQIINFQFSKGSWGN